MDAGAMQSSMRPYMRMQNLFVREIDTSLSRDTVISELSNHCPPAQGKVVVPVSDATGGILGIAYLNFANPADASQLLKAKRFELQVCGKPVRLTFAVDPRWREHLFGPFGFRFQVNVKNLDAEVDEPALFERFSAHGEVYQARVEEDESGRRSGVIQYLDESSVQEALRVENGAQFGGTRILVEPHSRAAQYSNYGPHSDPGRMPQPAMRHSPAGSFGAAPLGGNSQRLFGQQQGPMQQQQQQHAPPPPPAAMMLGHPRRSGSPSGLPAHLSAMLDKQGEAMAIGQQQYGEAVAGVNGMSIGGTAGAQYGMAQHQQQQQQQQHHQQQQQQQLYSGGGMGYTSTAAASAGAGAAAGGAAGRSGPLLVPDLVRQLAGRVDLLTSLLRCPISREVFRDPVVASDGHTYERAAIAAWLQKSDSSPVTGQPLARGALLPNALVRSLAEELAPPGRGA
ncbi:hypothetical protein Rsub_05540 [Raphidocelis subcapitata]|uniref:U-box domain-containing protein n=1 Tax=Raphidocelis subcapitata TaxID=307507 RepID=A0A2V0NXH6_9CHLO|nr:hypothetical protein Rsub_05540 [Raphidocelis subcapitata]|eukprot:GBF92338.1 hypothetical protein Rsub_05540 [Raphidocelis subcapitata]